MPGDIDSVLDIIAAANQIEEYLQGATREILELDTMRADAVVRRLEIIGEATKRLSSELRAQHREIPWKRIAGIRDVLIHAYDHVDLDLVWSIATKDLPDLVSALGHLVPNSAEE